MLHSPLGLDFLTSDLTSSNPTRALLDLVGDLPVYEDHLDFGP